MKPSLKIDLEQIGNVYVDLTDEIYSSVQIDPEDIKYRLEHDCEFFINFFLYEELTVPVPDFHFTCWELMTNEEINRVAMALPRGHAKTTLAKLAVVWHFLFSQKRFIVYLSNTRPVSIEACRDIWHFLHNENFVKIFGRPEAIVAQEGNGLFQFKLGDKYCILRAFGAGQQVRGVNINNMRPEMAIVDDLEDLDNTNTQDLLKKLRTWLYRTFFKALARRNKIIWIGNIISGDCILYTVLTGANEWNSLLYGCILEDHTSLWPDLFSIEFLLKDFQEHRQIGEASGWFTEMMNFPIPAESGLIRSEEIHMCASRSPEDLQAVFITIDPAISMKAAADDTAIAVHGIVDRKVEIVDYYQGKLDPLQTIEKVLDFCFLWRCRFVGVEATAYQASLKFWFNIELQRRQLRNIQIEQLMSQKTKTERLFAWASMIKAGYYLIPNWDTEIVRQLITYDAAKNRNKDDLIDCCAQGIMVLEMHLQTLLMKSRDIDDTPPLFRELQCTV